MTHLPPYIIEELRRIEEARREQQEDNNRPRLYIPIPYPPAGDQTDYVPEQSIPRGPIVIDITTGETLEA
jgi:hypothetical protein